MITEYMTSQLNLKDIKIPKVGDIVEGVIIGKGRSSVFLSLGNWGTGVIYGKEFYEAKEKLKELKKGDAIFVKIVELENEDGYIGLSLTKAGAELAWDTIRRIKEKNESIVVKIKGANKGGLLSEVSGISAFLPVSQLSSQNYPKVEDGDTQKILKALQKFVGREMRVKILDLKEQDNQVILSEKAQELERIKNALKDYKVGDIVEGEISGIVDFGAFIKFSLPQLDKKENEEKDKEEVSIPKELEGLIHISELDWQLVEDPAKIVKVGQKVKAKIIDITDGRFSLSLKALKKDPWENIEKEFPKESIVKGEVIKLNPFGAFVRLNDKIQGLCHISEFGSQEKMKEKLEVGKKYDFQIISIEPKEHRMSLRLVEKSQKNE